MKAFLSVHRLRIVAWLFAVGGATALPQTRCGSASLSADDAQGKKAATALKTETQNSKNTKPTSADWRPLFDGKTLNGWKITDFAGTGKVEVESGQIMLHEGAILTGVNCTNEIAKTNFEVELEAMKVQGQDFFCCLTFPVKDSHCSFVVGGWGGAVVGISSIDGMDASENETTKFMNFDKNRWYRIRVRVTPAKIETWIDDEKFADQPLEDRKISMRPGEIELSAPFGVATYQTTAALRNIRIRDLKGK
jgi:hypothetical protein